MRRTTLSDLIARATVAALALGSIQTPAPAASAGDFAIETRDKIALFG
jgi:hypothetical protein